MFKGLVVSHLQYADDIFCDMWMLKSMLRGFDMISVLKANYWKGCFVGVNVFDEFLDSACSFLNCRLGMILFMYLLFRSSSWN
jgi:hypothetical protein